MSALLDLLDLLISTSDMIDIALSFRRITDGTKAERKSPVYGAPAMRRLRWIARTVVVAYLVAAVAAPFWLSDTIVAGYLVNHVLLAILIYLAGVLLGLWAFTCVFDRRREAIAARLADTKSK